MIPDSNEHIAIDTVAVRLMRAARETDASRVAVCSAHRGDGKSTLIRRVGDVLARAGSPSMPTPTLIEGPSLLEPHGYLELEQLRGDVDAAVLVIRRRATRADELSLMHAWCDAHGIQLLGVVFTPPTRLSLERLTALYERLHASSIGLLPARWRPTRAVSTAREIDTTADIVALDDHRGAI
jgi:hypothetical protein